MVQHYAHTLSEYTLTEDSASLLDLIITDSPEFWLCDAFNMFNIYMYWERNPLWDPAQSSMSKKEGNV